MSLALVALVLLGLVVQRPGRGPGALVVRGDRTVRASGRGTGGRSGACGVGAFRGGRRRDAAGRDLDPLLTLALVDAALRTGVPVPRALRVVGGAVGGAGGGALRRAGALLDLGSAWDDAWTGSAPGLAVTAAALRGAWEAGAAPGAALRVAAEQVRVERSARARAAAARLGTHLVLPLGLCFLPSFVLLGLVPVVVSLTGSLGW